MEEKRVKTFIELTRQALDEERIGELDFKQRGRPSPGDARLDDKRRGDHPTGRR